MGEKQSKKIDTPSNICVSSNDRIVQNFQLVWLDANINESDADFQNSIRHLRRVVNAVKLFTDTDKCIDFLKEIKTEKIFLILSGSLGQLVISNLHDITQIYSIYIFCRSHTKHENWIKNWTKIKGIYVQIELICQSLKYLAQQCDENSISISFLSTNNVENEDDDEFKKKINQLDPSFMYTQILKEILFEIKYRKDCLTDLVEYCQNLYHDNEHELKNLDKFRENYRHQSSIWWYTYDCCIYSMLNRALRNQEVDTIIKMGFFIRDLHQQIKQLHEKQYSNKRKNSKLFIVYRGQSLSLNDFEKLVKTQSGLLSFNNFLSTTIDKNVALDFVQHSIEVNPKFVGILFQMFINPTVSMTPFASVNKKSYFKDREQEILFSMHTIFRINRVQQIENSIWQVDLTLTDSQDKQLNILTDKIRQETQEKSGWPRLGNLLIRLGNFNAAEDVYNVLLELATNENDKAYFYHQLGVINDNQNHHTDAISFYKKSLQIYQKQYPSYHPALAQSYKSIALVCNNTNEYSDALFFQHKALEIEEYIYPKSHISLIASYNNIGSILVNLKDYSKAILFHEKALHICEKLLPVNHPLFANSYDHLACTYQHMEDYSRALIYEELAVEIGQSSLSKTHPHLILYKKNLNFIKSKLNIE